MPKTSGGLPGGMGELGWCAQVGGIPALMPEIFL